jgi:hypothetical protein
MAVDVVVFGVVSAMPELRGNPVRLACCGGAMPELPPQL